MKFALGKLGWTAYDYYTSLPIEFYAAFEGYQERQKEKSFVIRFAAFRIAESMVGTKALGDINKFWPMESDDKKEVKKVEPMTKERYNEIMARHNIKVK